jgi:hypothetical protein
MPIYIKVAIATDMSQSEARHLGLPISGILTSAAGHTIMLGTLE